VSILFLQPKNSADGTEIGPGIEKAFGRDFADHHTVADAVLMKGVDHLRELAEPGPNHRIHEGREIAIALVFEADRNELANALCARLARQHERQRAVTRDDAKRLNLIGH